MSTRHKTHEVMRSDDWPTPTARLVQAPPSGPARCAVQDARPAPFAARRFPSRRLSSRVKRHQRLHSKSGHDPGDAPSCDFRRGAAASPSPSLRPHVSPHRSRGLSDYWAPAAFRISRSAASPGVCLSTTRRGSSAFWSRLGGTSWALKLICGSEMDRAADSRSRSRISSRRGKK